MNWQIMVALAVVIPVILLPVLFIWFLNIGGILAARKEAKAREKTTIQATAVKVEAKG